MALSVTFLAFFLFFLIIASSTVQARESQFFNKFSRYTKNTNTTTTTNTNTNTNITINASTTINGNTAANNNTITTTVTIHAKQGKMPKEQNLSGKQNDVTISTVQKLPKEEQVPSGKQEETLQTSNSYGLYSHGSSDDPSTTTTMTPTGFTDVENSQYFNQFSPTTTNTETSLYATVPEKTKTEGYNGGSSVYGEFNDNYKKSNGYEYETKQYGVSDTRSMDSENNNNVYEAKPDVMTDTRGFNNNNGGSSHYEAGQYGLSDTRLLEKGSSNNNNNNLSGMKQQGLSDTRFMANGRYYYDANNRGLDNNGGGTSHYEAEQNGLSDMRFLEKGSSSSNNNNNFSGMKQQGMSDTRFMANGRYYYDVNNENYDRNEYRPASGSRDEFESSRGMDSRNNHYQTYNGNTENPNEFDDSEYQEEINKENQGGYFP